MTQAPPPPPAEEPGASSAPGSTTPPTTPTQPPADVPGEEERMWAMCCHLSIFAGLLPVIPAIGCVLAPLILWLIKREHMPLVADQGKEALNFAITAMIVGVILGVASGLTIIIPPLACIMWPVIGLVGVALAIVAGVYIVIASMEAQKGNRYRYPYCWRIVT